MYLTEFKPQTINDNDLERSVYVRMVPWRPKSGLETYKSILRNQSTDHHQRHTVHMHVY